MSERINDLARALAEPMPRRRAVGLLVGAMLGAVWPGRSIAAASPYQPSDYGCPDAGDLYCGGCRSVGGLFYGHVCCPGPDAAKYWECGCQPPPNGGTLCKKKPCKQCGYECCYEGQFCGSPKHSRCCDNGQEPCTGEDGAFQCCDPGTMCCGGTCCFRLTQRCGEGGTCTCKAGNTHKCGGDCCNPRLHKCCPGPPDNSLFGSHCVPKDNSCCGSTSCYPDEHCCGGQTCVAKTKECCGTVGFDPSFQKCCGPGVVCPREYGCCDEVCCPPTHMCTNSGCVPRSKP